MSSVLTTVSQVGTSRVIWSYNPNDPQNDSPSALQQHTMMGWRSVNLLNGGDGAKVPLPADVQEFTVGVTNVDRSVVRKASPD